jgi:hypothetical protein
MDTSSKNLEKLGAEMQRRLEQFQNDKQLKEQQWLKNLRQYRRKYDPDIEARIPEERSHAYPGDTRKKIKAAVSKLMEMMFPATERNWELESTPVPSIPEEALGDIIAKLQNEAQGQVVTSEAIEREVKVFADKRREAMQEEIADQLADPGVDYPHLCKQVVESGYLFGTGVARCPMVRTQKERFWERNSETGRYEAKTKLVRRPYPEFVRSWDIYPDLSAKSWYEQELIFERLVVSRNEFRKLADRPDFKEDVIKEYLREHPGGNFREQEYEAELQQLGKTSNLADRTTRRYEVFRGLGFFSAHDLAKVGVPIEEADMHEDVLADIWIIDSYVIKAEKAAFGSKPSDQYHAFTYSEEEGAGLTGIGLPEEIRDSQMAICAATRALLDNMAASCGPVVEENTELLTNGRGGIGPVHAFKVISREGTGPDAAAQAVRFLDVPSHIPEILEIVNAMKQQMETESDLPAFATGDMKGLSGEAFRTSNNMSMMMGSASTIAKGTVRSFDKFTSGLISAMVKWNMRFNPKEEIKGDFQVNARGAHSLMAKEVRGAALDQFVATLGPEEKAVLDRHGLLEDRLKARDLPTKRLLPKEEAEAIWAQMQQAEASAQQVEQGLTAAKTQDHVAGAANKQASAQAMSRTTDAVIADLFARAGHAAALAQSTKDKTQLENLALLLSTIGGTNATDANGVGANVQGVQGLRGPDGVEGASQAPAREASRGT